MTDGTSEAKAEFRQNVGFYYDLVKANVLRTYIRHDNRARPDRALDLHPPDPASAPLLQPITMPHPQQVKRHDLLAGLIHEYEVAAA